MRRWFGIVGAGLRARPYYCGRGQSPSPTDSMRRWSSVTFLSLRLRLRRIHLPRQREASRCGGGGCRGGFHIRPITGAYGMPPYGFYTKLV